MRWLDLDTLDELVITLSQNRLRAGLTALGVGWGTFLLVLMLGFGDGLEQAVVRNMQGSTANAMHVWGRRTHMAYNGLRANRPVDFTLSDRDALKSEVPGVLYACPRTQLGGYRDGTAVRAGRKVGAFQVMGDSPDYRHVQVMRMLEGRWINERDMDDRRKVAVIGRSVADDLFGERTDLVGESMEIQGVWFVVGGVFESPRGDERGDREASTVHLPITTFQRVFHTGDDVGWYALLADPERDASVMEVRARAVLSERHGIHPDDGRALGSWNAAEEFGRIRALFGGIRMFTWLVGAATLLSGVVGVSNILLITVRERTAEIGLRRAIGATPSQVVGMILSEAITLTTLAGCTGLVLGVAAVEAIRMAVGPNHASLGQPDLDASTLLAAAVLLLAGGAFAGFLPALRAAAIEPVEALRSE